MDNTNSQQIIIGQPAPCPTCGACPTCGRGNAYIYPWWQQPWWQSPWTYTTEVTIKDPPKCP